MAPGIKNKKLSETETIIAISLPTWEQVLEWFRNKGFIGTVEYKDFYSENNYEYAFCIINKLDKKTYHSIGNSITKTYEEAREALVNKLIEVYGKSI